ncbi:PAS domain-containing protein [Pelotomaculum propionicicum]|uniref:PAS domain-containing protein n=1 Tax=Pelotomaculum propionicicum TaxID=258475 RepID=UPI003B7C07E7
MDVKSILDNLEAAAVASDAQFNIVYINKQGEKAFKELLNQENIVGRNMAECHQPETMKKLKELYQEFRDRKKVISHYTMDTPGGKLTLLQVPYFDGDELAGVVEFIFEGSLA